MTAAPDWFALIAESRGVPAGWTWHQAEVLGDGPREHCGFKLTGGVCVETFRSGPRKGRPNIAKRTDKRELLISFQEFDAFKNKWQSETGLCWNCGGSGQVLASHSVIDGKTYRPCRRCQPRPAAVSP